MAIKNEREAFHLHCFYKYRSKKWSFFETFIRDKLDKCVIFYFDFKSAFESIVLITQFSMSH